MTKLATCHYCNAEQPLTIFKRAFGEDYFIGFRCPICDRTNYDSDAFETEKEALEALRTDSYHEDDSKPTTLA
jgi:hypothetical protein